MRCAAHAPAFSMPVELARHPACSTVHVSLANTPLSSPAGGDSVAARLPSYRQKEGQNGLSFVSLFDDVDQSGSGCGSQNRYPWLHGTCLRFRADSTRT